MLASVRPLAARVLGGPRERGRVGRSSDVSSDQTEFLLVLALDVLRSLDLDLGRGNSEFTQAPAPDGRPRHSLPSRTYSIRCPEQITDRVLRKVLLRTSLHPVRPYMTVL